MNAELTILHVATPNPAFVGYEAGPKEVRESRSRELRKERAQLLDMAKALERKGISAQARLIEGPTVETILQLADEYETDFIVICSHGHSGLYSAIVGTVSEGVIKRAACPILVIPHHCMQTEKKVQGGK